MAVMKRIHALPKKGSLILRGMSPMTKAMLRMRDWTKRHLMPLKMMSGTMSAILEECTRRESVSVKETNWE